MGACVSSAWGSSWGAYWGNAWGSAVAPTWSSPGHLYPGNPVASSTLAAFGVAPPQLVSPVAPELQVDLVTQEPDVPDVVVAGLAAPPSPLQPAAVGQPVSLNPGAPLITVTIH